MGQTDRRTPGGRRLWKCDGPGCGMTAEPWGRNWLWYGSLRQIDEEPDAIKTFCGKGCADTYSAMSGGAIPMTEDAMLGKDA